MSASRGGDRRDSAIASTTLTMGVKVGEGGKLYGSITSKDIADALGRRGIEVDRHKIDLDEPLKMLGTYKVAIKVYHRDDRRGHDRRRTQGLAQGSPLTLFSSGGNSGRRPARMWDLRLRDRESSRLAAPAVSRVSQIPRRFSVDSCVRRNSAEQIAPFEGLYKSDGRTLARARRFDRVAGTAV